MSNAIQRVGQSSINLCAQIGSSGIFLAKTLVRRPRPIKAFPLLIQELHFIGVFSLPIILVAAIFIGLVLGLQVFNILNKFISSEQL